MKDVQHLTELREILQRRCRILEVQAATYGTMVAPQILIEIEELKKEVAAIETQMVVNIPPADRKNLGELWRNAIKEFLSKDWNRAEEYLIQVAAIDPNYSHVQETLKITRTHLYFDACYRAVSDLKAEGDWRGVLEGMNLLKQEHPDSDDPEGLLVWAEEQQRAAF